MVVFEICEPFGKLGAARCLRPGCNVTDEDVCVTFSAGDNGAHESVADKTNARRTHKIYDDYVGFVPLGTRRGPNVD